MVIIAGSDGTGKSSLIKEFIKVRTDYIYLEGFSRSVKKVRDVCELDADKEQILLNRLTVDNFIQVHDQKVISPRSILDAIVYTRVLTPEKDTVAFEQIFKRYAERCNIFYLPVEFKSEEKDSLRFSEELNEQFDIGFKDVLSDISYTTLSGGVEERLNTLLSTLNSLETH